MKEKMGFTNLYPGKVPNKDVLPVLTVPKAR